LKFHTKVQLLNAAKKAALTKTCLLPFESKFNYFSYKASTCIFKW